MFVGHKRGFGPDRGAGRRLVAACWLAGILALGCRQAVPEAVQDAASAGADFVALREPVLDHVVERQGDGDLYRVRRWASGADPGTAPGEVFCTGSLDVCERALVASLEERHGTGLLNLPVATLGAKQFWADVFWWSDWRIQENVYTGHARLLDPGDVRRAWGTSEACRTAFERQRVQHGVPAPREELVLLLHGLGRSRTALAPLVEGLRAGGRDVVNVSYPSTRRSLAEHAAQVSRLLDAMPEARRVSFVTHSLGGLVARQVLGDGGDWSERHSVGRLVMLAPPSRGSALADGLAEWLPFRIIAGPSGQDVTSAGAANVPLPTCEFAVIAASGPFEDGWNPVVPGDDDAVVSVEETWLQGVDAFLVVESTHTFIMQEPEVGRAVQRFLDTGSFDDASEPSGDEPELSDDAR